MSSRKARHCMVCYHPAQDQMQDIASQLHPIDYFDTVGEALCHGGFFFSF